MRPPSITDPNIASNTLHRGDVHDLPQAAALVVAEVDAERLALPHLFAPWMDDLKQTACAAAMVYEGVKGSGGDDAMAIQALRETGMPEWAEALATSSYERFAL